jgi:hypothetical protein
MTKYNLGFISDKDIFQHVKETVELYQSFIDLKEFNKNIIDPIKLTFDSKIYGSDFSRTIESECIRQMDKHNQNHIGYFHQNIFKYAGNGWSVPPKGFDVVNEHLKIYVEIKNKHNTMNANSGQATMMHMLQKIAQEPDATCMLVEAIASHSQNIVWSGTFRGVSLGHDERIRRVSMDQFYDIVFDDKYAFCKLCKALPQILDDVITSSHQLKMKNTVYSELKKISPNILKSLYLLAFKTYDGFDKF